jgi:hypothetical protein
MSPNSINNVLFYPFTVNEQLPYPDTIIVTDFRTDQQVKFTRSANGIYFEIAVNTFEISLYRVSYTQRTYAFSMQYLLRTTAQWKKPFEQAVYRVRIPSKYMLTSSTIMFPQMREQNNEQVFETCEERFMPSTDFIIQWERKLP